MKMIPQNYTIEMILQFIKNNEMRFDNPVQRGFVWRKKRKSFLIHSVIVGYPIDTVFANKMGRVFDVFDGQQRLTSISQYVNGNFKLSEVPLILVYDNNIEDLAVLNFNQFPKSIQKIVENSGEYENSNDFKNKPFKSYSQKLKSSIMDCEEVVNISGKNFDDLPETIKQTILDYNIDLQYAENLSQSQIAVLFDRLNSGKSLTATEKAKAQILSPHAVERLHNHALFTNMLSEDAIIGKTSDTYIMQAYVALFCEYDKCLLGSKIERVLSREEITEEQEATLMSCFNVYLEAVNTVKEREDYIDKKLRRVLKAKSHFASLLPVAEMVVKNNIDTDMFIGWLRYFFGTKVGTATVSSEYNSKLNDAGNSHLSVLTRINAAKNNFSEYLKNPPEQKMSEQLSI